MISHDVDLLDAVVNKVWYLDANRAALDVYNVGWKTYLQQRETDERRRHRERANAERKIEALRSQADKMRAKATKARAAHQMDRRAAALAAGLAEVRVGGQGRPAALPGAGAVRTHPADRRGAVEVLRLARGVHRRRPRRRPRRPGRRPRPQRRRQDHAAAAAGRHRGSRTPARSCPATACGWATTPRSTRRSTTTGRCWRTCAPRRSVGRRRPDRHRTAQDPRRVPVLRRRRRQAGRRALRRREDPAGAGDAGDQRGQRAAARRADEQPRPGQPGAGARRAAHATPARSCWSPTTRARSRRSQPEKVILLPDGVEDTWSADLADLIALA